MISAGWEGAERLNKKKEKAKKVRAQPKPRAKGRTTLKEEAELAIIVSKAWEGYDGSPSNDRSPHGSYYP